MDGWDGVISRGGVFFCWCKVNWRFRVTLDQSSSPFQVDFFWGKHDSANERWFLQANGIHDVNEFALVFPFSFNFFFQEI